MAITAFSPVLPPPAPAAGAAGAALGGTALGCTPWNAASPTPPVQGTAAENKQMQTSMKQTDEYGYAQGGKCWQDKWSC